MKLERMEPGSGQPALGALLGGALLGCGALASFWLRFGLPVPTCVFRSWTGIPCPGCGSTRSIEALLGGDVGAAAGWNPLLFAALLTVAAWGIVSASGLALGLAPRRIVLERRERFALRVVAVVVLAAGWSYLIWRGI